MAGIFSRILFHNGKLPWLQIILGIIIGAVSSLLYVRYRKPTALVEFLNISPPSQAINKSICDDGVCSLGDQRTKEPLHEEKPRREAKADELAEELPPVFPLPIYITEDLVKNRNPPRKRTTELAPIEEVQEEEYEEEDCEEE